MGAQRPGGGGGSEGEGWFQQVERGLSQKYHGNCFFFSGSNTNKGIIKLVVKKLYKKQK